MAYIPDMSARTYSKCPPGFLSVGWLDKYHEYTKGKVDPAFLFKLLSLDRVNDGRYIYRGYHACNLCPAEKLTQVGKDGVERMVFDLHGNGEIHIPDGAGITYTAPVLIKHYVLHHNYKPPEEFIEAVMRYGEAQEEAGAKEV